MSWMKWLPWRYLVKRVAHRHGFLDPIALLAKLHRFAQPSEVGEPIDAVGWMASALEHHPADQAISRDLARFCASSLRDRMRTTGDLRWLPVLRVRP